ncbi:MAG: hypothetical protein E7390_05975 [Ruminococcaceae bacterium]|nr:hypothetical protein [Oscillospiraceae bacterium]
MIRISNEDPFYSKQPPLGFLKELKMPLHQEKKFFFGTGQKQPDEIEVEGIYLVKSFPDPAGSLLTAYEDFDAFIKLYGISGNAYPIYLVQEETDVFESFTVETDEKETVIRAGDTEGIRRAIMYIEDAFLSAEGPWLKKGITKQKPAIKTRITRGFFSPTNRPPHSKDELFDEVDYYPEPYLARLMHDGINGLWIYTRFSDLLPSSYITEYGKGSEKRLKKLNRVIQKCARYGIGVYVFAIEPFFFRDYPELKEKYAFALGAEIEGGYRANCLETSFMQGYIKEAGERLVKACPDLRGWISITVGEGLTHCASNTIKTPCPRCGTMPRSRVLAKAVDVLNGAFSESPGTDFISWSYAQRMWDVEEIRDYVQNAPAGSILMQNFEDTVEEEQLGKQRLGIDYWLSAIGPSKRFCVTAEEGRKTGKRIFAKMQVCCSHEVASVPYVPVPGILYKKYKAAIALGVEGVVQCWYFGNYPSVMSKAAGLLSFMDVEETEEAFLLRLAAVHFGRTNAGKIVKAWKLFETGYRQYPLNILTSYYGPMHDGVVWQLALKPKNFSLPRTWKLEDKPDGDRICDCLGFGHTLPEAETLSENMKTAWDEGLKVLQEILPNENEMVSVSQCLGILFGSANRIFRFYRLRNALGEEKGNPEDILKEMRQIVLEEIEASRRMAVLCGKDTRLGYHSEAEGYKFFPEKLSDRIEKLHTLLKTEFCEVETRIQQGLLPLAYYGAEEDGSRKYTLENRENARWEYIGERSRFRAYYDNKTLYIDLSGSPVYWLSAEFELFSPTPRIGLEEDGTVSVTAEMHASLSKQQEDEIRSMWQCTSDGETLHVKLDRAAIGWEKDTPFKMKLADSNGTLWQEDPMPVRTLGKGYYSPGDYGWFVPKGMLEGKRA